MNKSFLADELGMFGWVFWDGVSNKEKISTSCFGFYWAYA